MQLATFERREDSDGDESSPEASASLADAALGFDTLEFGRLGVRRLGALIPPGPHAGDVVDLNRALAVKLAFDDVGAPEAEADSLLPAEMRAFLTRGRPGIEVAARAFTWAVGALARYDGPDLIRSGVVLPRRRVRLCAPITRPTKIVAVARNYAAHAAERGASPPKEPVLFLKSPSAVIGPGDDIELPRASSEVDYEGELAVVIGRSAHEVSVRDALDFVAGYTAANDVTARDFQNVRGQHFIGKSCDTFAPLGPVLVTADEIDDPQALELRTVVSGEQRQHGNTGDMVFSVAELIAFTSRLMTLEPGDVLLTGTPSGVGAADDPPRWLREGDVVDVEVDGIGQLRNYVR